MMKLTWKRAGLVFLLTAALLTGCSNTSKDTGKTAAETQAVQTVDAAQTIYGEVESIVGNEVTLALGTVDSAGGRGAHTADTEDAATEEAPSGEMPSGEAPSGDFPSGGMPSGEKPSSGEMPSGTGRGNSSGSSGGSVTLEKTGETATYILPVGMSIGTGDFSSVSSGMVLSLSLDADGNVLAASILSR